MNEPLVSVLVCTQNRRHLIPSMIQCYESQSWKNKELVVVDDGSDRVLDLFCYIPNLTYFRSGYMTNLAKKRNIGIKIARGDVVIHFDDDDWSGPDRIADTMTMFADPTIQLAGYHEAYWWDRNQNLASLYTGYMWGATIAYRRSWGLSNPFPEHKPIGEDRWFISEAGRQNVAAWKTASVNFVSVIHNGNRRDGYFNQMWKQVEVNELPSAFRLSEKI